MGPEARADLTVQLQALQEHVLQLWLQGDHQELLQGLPCQAQSAFHAGEDLDCAVGGAEEEHPLYSQEMQAVQGGAQWLLQQGQRKGWKQNRPLQGMPPRLCRSFCKGDL